MDKATAKRRLANAGNGLLNAMATAAEIPAITRMTDIERDIDRLQEEYARINETLSTDHRRTIPYQK